MDFQQYLANNAADEPVDEELLSRIVKLIENDPELALFGVSLVSALKGNQLSEEQVHTYLTEAEDRLAQS